MAKPQILSHTTSRFDGRSYLFYDPETRKGALVDPDLGAETLWKQAQALGVSVEWILITHGHYDHIGTLKEAKKATGAIVCVSAQDAIKLTDDVENMGRGMEACPPRIPADRQVGEGDILPLGQMEIRVLATPGHTPGCLCFLCGGALFSGDTLFRDTVGATHFPGGDEETLRRSVARLTALPADLEVYPGHGPSGRMGRIRQALAFLGWVL